MRGYSLFGFMLVMALIALASGAWAESLDDSMSNIEDRWASVAFESNEKEKRRKLTKLLDDVRRLHASWPDKPEVAAWHGIVAQSYMDVRDTMGIAKEARDALLVAESIDPLVLDGQVYAHLGALYSRTRSGFGGFGSSTRAIGYLWKAITVDPQGIDANYLYAELLYKEKNYSAARDALIKAAEAPLRPEHSKVDTARKVEVRDLLAAVERRLTERS